MQNVFAATGNAGKLREFVNHAGPGIAVKALPRFDSIAPCQETGATFEANARLKAEYYSEQCEGLVFADDSGIEVDALGGRPGVYSARYAGPSATDSENNERLIAELQGVDPERRTARYVCVIALARGGEVLATFEGAAAGLIHSEPRGAGGFGYDPYFFFPPLRQTFAEISGEEKWLYSHRGEAFRKMLAFLRIMDSRGPQTT
jgi:XTP/dITP diphosphohydrolase